ncbi:MAG: hypothetical protein AAF593_16910 [Planctomycetota bacterium]
MLTLQRVQLTACLIGLFMVTLTACVSKEVAPGVTQGNKETRTVVAALPKATADAAERVLVGLELTDVNRSATQIDGLVTASTALGAVVEVKIKAAGARTSEVAVTHAAGEGLAFEIIQAVEQQLSGASPASAAPPAPPAPVPPATPATPSSGGAGADHAVTR